MLHEVARIHAPPIYASSKVTPLETSASQKESNAPEFTTPDTNPIAADNERANGTDRTNEGGSDYRRSLAPREGDASSCRADADSGGGSEGLGLPPEGGEGNPADTGEEGELQGVRIDMECATKNAKQYTEHNAERLRNGESPHHPAILNFAAQVYWVPD